MSTLSRAIIVIAFVIGVLAFSSCAKRRGPSSVFVEQPKEDETKDAKLKRQEEIIRQQHKELERQQKIIEDLQRQRYYNRAFEPKQKKK